MIRYIGLNIEKYRKLKNMSRMDLADKVADALGVSVVKLLEAW